METKFMHFTLGRGRVTAAIQSDGVAAKMTASFCSPNDQFSRKKGRMIAEGRLAKGKILHMFTVDPTKRLDEQVFDFFAEAQADKLPELPQWAK